MVSQPLSRLPSTTELPCSDDTPVDNEDQNLLPNLLLFMLVSLWSERMDWYFGVDMAVYHTTGVNVRVPVVPDAFLSIGVERRKASRQGKGRLSYAVWEEGGVVPIMAIEMVSQTPGGEYDEKLEIYQRLGVLYYVVYNPLTEDQKTRAQARHLPFEVFKLVEGEYRQQLGEPYWMPEVGLGIGRAQRTLGGIDIELLLWHDEAGQPYPIPEEKVQQMEALIGQQQQKIARQQQRLQQQQRRLEQQKQQLEEEQQQKAAERQRAERLAERLRSLGINPDDL